MKRLIRRGFILLLCCWLPMSAVAAVVLDCHLLQDSAETSVLSGGTPPTVVEHHDCSGKTDVSSATPDLTRQLDAAHCDHCQGECRSGQILVISRLSTATPFVSLSPLPYVLPRPAAVFNGNLQRPPQPSSLSSI